MHSKPYMHVTGRKLEGVEVVLDHVMAQEAMYALQVIIPCYPLTNQCIKILS